MPEDFTVFGAKGLIGSALTHRLMNQGANVRSVTRGNWPKPGTHLGHIVFSIGMTANFRQNLSKTVELHVEILDHVLKNFKFYSFLYISSTRVYQNSTEAKEDNHLLVNPNDVDNVYNISKICGESLCLSSAMRSIRVVRLSNVFAPTIEGDLFIPSILRDAISSGYVLIGQSSQSQKDYADLDDVAEALICITLRGRRRLYNVASGTNTSHAHIADTLRSKGIQVNFADNGPVIRFPEINVQRFTDEFGFAPRPLHERLATIIDTLRDERAT